MSGDRSARTSEPIHRQGLRSGVAGPRRLGRLGLRPGEQKTLAAAVAIFLAFQFVLGPWGWPRHEAPVLVDSATGRGYEFLIELNEASWPELMLLPRIGEKRARQIVAWREQHGPFESLDQLQQVHGIGPKTVQQIRKYVLVNPTR